MYVYQRIDFFQLQATFCAGQNVNFFISIRMQVVQTKVKFFIIQFQKLDLPCQELHQTSAKNSKQKVSCNLFSKKSFYNNCYTNFNRTIFCIRIDLPFVTLQGHKDAIMKAPQIVMLFLPYWYSKIYKNLQNNFKIQIDKANKTMDVFNFSKY